MENWWQTLSSQQEQQPLDVLENFVAQGRAFFELGERIARSAADTEEAFDWEKLSEKALASMKQMFDWPSSAAPNLGFWQLPLDNWQRTMSSMAAGVPGDYLRGFSPEVLTGEGARAKLDHFLSTPSVGYSREFQDQYQHLAKLVLAYEKAYHRYVATLMELAKRSVELLQKRLHDRAVAHEPVTSLRELYNLWVDSSEDVYGSHVLKDEYVQVHGELVNALMALKHHGSRMIDEVAGTFNLPTRVEMDTVHRRLQQTRRENHGLQDRVADLTDQIITLREQLEKLTVTKPQRGATRAKATSKPATGTAGKKKTRAKSTTKKGAVTK